MKTTKKLLAVLSVCASFTACGKTENVESSTTDTGTVTSNESSEVSAASIESLFPFATDDGKALPTYAENVKAIDELTDHTVTELAYENFDSDGNNDYDKLFTFKSKDMPDVQESDNVYYTTFLSATGEEYLVTFGETDTAELDEASMYVNHDTELTYFAYGTTNGNGSYHLTPVIAGNDEIGYYFVRSNIRMIGYNADELQPITIQSSQTV